ncbi:MAG: tyrosine-protein phosphatase [Cyclobacteriaceae bacterium]
MFHFFRRKKAEPVFDWPVDMHSHLVPGVDDGCRTVEESLSILRYMREMGVKKWITTPHIFYEYYRNDPSTIEAGYLELKKHLAEVNEDFEITFAAEYYFDEHLVRMISEKPLLTFGNQYLLVETNMLSEPHGLNEFIFQAGLKGYTIILAHPERYSYMLGNFKRLEELKDRGVMLQVNMLSYSGFYSIPSMKMVREMTDLGLIDFIGSDCHNLQQATMIREASKDKYFRKTLALKLVNYSL